MYSLNTYDLKENLFPGKKMSLATCALKILGKINNIAI